MRMTYARPNKAPSLFLRPLKYLTLLFFSLSFVSFGFSQEVFWEVNPKKDQKDLSDEALLVANIPVEIVKREIKKILIDAPQSPFQKIEHFKFDPLNRLVVVEGPAELPGNIMADLQSAAGGFELKRVHDLKIIFKLPSARQLAVSSYVTIEFVEFKIDGQDYVSAFPILGRFFSTLLSHPSFVDYTLDINPDVPLDAHDPVNRARQFIERKNIRFRENTVSFKLDLTEFSDFERFSELKDLRLWQFSPVLLKGTDQVVFRIEAGLGRPSDSWVLDAKARGENDEQSLVMARQKLYLRYEYDSIYAQQIQNQIDILYEDLKLGELSNAFTKREVDQLSQRLKAQARQTLTQENPEFLSTPEHVFDEFRNFVAEHSISALSDIKRRAYIQEQNYVLARNKKDFPFLSKRISQKTISQVVRYFRDFKFEGEDLFSELNLVLAPQFPGFIVRGVVNLDFNTLMMMGFDDDTRIDLGNLPIRAAEDQYGSGVPFEMSLRTLTLNGGKLGLDIKSLSLFTGTQRTSFVKGGRHGTFLLNFAKMAIAHSLASTWIDLPSDNTSDERDSYKVLKQHIKKQDQLYSLLEGQSAGQTLGEALQEVAELDIQKNPFITVGRDFVAGKTQLVLDELISFDEEKELLVFDLNPKVISESILSAENSVEVWNVLPIVDTEANETYLELALGDGERTQKYLKSLRSRDEFIDSAHFSGLDFRESTGSDVSVTMNLTSFERLVNSILTQASSQQAGEVEKQLDKDAEFETYILQDLNLNATQSGFLEMSVLLTHVEKSKRSVLNPARWFGNKWDTTKKSIGLKSEVEISLEKLEDYRKSLKPSSDEVFFHDQILRLDLKRAKVHIGGDTSILDKIVNIAARDVNFESGIGGKVKSIVMSAIGKYLNPSDDKANENVVLGGVRLNHYAKVLSHDAEFLIQLNPHILGKSFEVRLRSPLGEDSFRPVIDKQNNLLRFDFETVGNMASADKTQLYRVMKRTEELIRPVLQAQNASEVQAVLADHQLANQLFRDSDYTKLSLFHQFERVVSQYEGMLNSTGPNLSVLRNIRQNISDDLNIDLPKEGSREITTSGVELMYILSTAYLLENAIYRYLKKIKDLNLEGTPYFRDIQALRNDLEERYILPLLQRYERDYKKRNQTILKKGVTDWNHSFYPDARYSEAVYKTVQKAYREFE